MGYFNLELLSMKINPTLYNKDYDNELITMLLNHFQYSIKDINSYDELTAEEKQIISEDLFNSITINY